eukprot:5549005-Amphidinium_carterae.1
MSYVHVLSLDLHLGLHDPLTPVTELLMFEKLDHHALHQCPPSTIRGLTSSTQDSVQKVPDMREGFAWKVPGPNFGLKTASIPKLAQKCC